MDERVFLIRKTIGWALRQHTRTAPTAIRHFGIAHHKDLSVLSFREATKHLQLADLDRDGIKTPQQP